jgi:hypothetical protein
MGYGLPETQPDLPTMKYRHGHIADIRRVMTKPGLGPAAGNPIRVQRVVATHQFSRQPPMSHRALLA